MGKALNNTSDFGSFLDAHLDNLKTDFSIGDRVAGTVTTIGKSTVFVDIKARSEGLIDRQELLDQEGTLTVKVGDHIEAFFTGWSDDCARLTTRMGDTVADASLEDAYRSGIPVEGRVAEERKGGYAVTVMGQSAFCPYSQIDLFRQDAATYVGQRFTFLISEYGEDGRNLVLSRRKLLEQERAAKRSELQASLAPGDLLDGTVTRLMPFGAFVDLGGVEGLIHVSELDWSRTAKAEDLLVPGQPVRVKVLELDWEKDRISLSLRQAGRDPWDDFVQSPDSSSGRRHSGTVTHLAPFGAFVEILPGVEGLLHISRLGRGRRINHPSEVLNQGDTLEVVIVDVDPEARRLSLAWEDNAADPDEAEPPPEYSAAGPPQAGARVSGTVEGHRDFGVFVRLPGERTGLLHVSQVELRGSSNPGKALYKMFPPASSIEVVILDVQGDRISLTLPATLDKEAESLESRSFTDSTSTQLGSLDGLFDGLHIDPSTSEQTPEQKGK